MSGKQGRKSWKEKQKNSYFLFISMSYCPHCVWPTFLKPTSDIQTPKSALPFFIQYCAHSFLDLFLERSFECLVSCTWPEQMGYTHKAELAMLETGRLSLHPAVIDMLSLCTCEITGHITWKHTCDELSHWFRFSAIMVKWDARYSSFTSSQKHTENVSSDMKCQRLLTPYFSIFWFLELRVREKFCFIPRKKKCTKRTARPEIRPGP